MSSAFEPLLAVRVLSLVTDCSIRSRQNRMGRRSRKPKTTPTVEPDRELLRHVQLLGLANIDDYVAWCAQHGFSRHTDKHWRVRVKELAFARRAIAVALLAQKKQEKRKPDSVIERIFLGELQVDDVTQPKLKAVCRACKAAEKSRTTRLAFRELLQHVSRCSELVSIQPVIGAFGRQPGNTFLEGLLALARHSRSWLRPVADWRPPTHNTRRQFSSLARHLLAEWPVPAFLDSVWFGGEHVEAVRREGWFLHVGRGQNIRTADLPLPYTKRMAHHFQFAPADFTVDHALEL